MKRLVVFFFLGIFGGGCISTPRIPDWAGKNWQEKQVFYFSGISSECSNAVCAKEEAYNNAIASIATFLGSTVTVITESNLDNNGQYLSAHFQSATQEMQLKHIKVEKFKVSQDKKYLVGYVLVSLEKREIDAVLTQIKQDADWQTHKQQNRRKVGVITIHAPRDWKDLEGQVNRFLGKAGYLTGQNGNNLYLQVENFACTQSHIQDVQICILQVKATFEQKELVFTAKGYGHTQAQAREDAIGAWIEQIPQDILEEK